MQGCRLRQFRTEKGYSQKDIAQILDVTTRTVSRWEQNNNQPSPDELEKLAKLMGTTVEELNNDSADDAKQNVLDKIFDGVDNLVSGQDSINESLLLNRDEYIKKQDEILAELRNQNDDLKSELSSYKKELDITKNEMRHKRRITVIVAVTCVLILALVFGTWLYWRNFGEGNGILVGFDQMGTPSYSENDDE